MKKNVMMRIASVLLIAVLISTCGISGTYAKYVSNGSADDTARVAMWGVTVTADASHNTFGGIYKNEINGNKLDTSYVFGTHSVSTTDGDLVAPGTKGDVAGLTISGTPEVDTMVTFTAQVDLEKWTVNSTEYYCPLVFYVTTVDAAGVAKTTPIYGTVYANADEFEAAIAAEVLRAKAFFPANTPINDDALSISWEWPFTTGTDNDLKDTQLGDAAATNVANAATVYIKITATVEQVD